VQTREWMMLALLIVVPLIIAVIVTLWSIKQIAYRPKKEAPPKPERPAETATTGGPSAAPILAGVTPPPTPDCETQDSTGRCRH
jgi:hypothetical protein